MVPLLRHAFKVDPKSVSRSRTPAVRLSVCLSVCLSDLSSDCLSLSLPVISVSKF